MNENAMERIITIWPDFAADFACKAGGCRHTCCRGWEIDVDSDTAQWYRSLDGPLGDELRRKIRCDDGTYSFRLTADERCPFLRSDGLCRLVLGLGEENLCEICTMHPRFFALCGGIELAGFGLACEKSTELLLAAKELRFHAEGERQSFTFPALLMFLGYPVPDAWLRPPARLTKGRMSFLLEQMEATEPIDAVWTRQLAALRAAGDSLLLSYAQLFAALGEAVARRLTSYILYRQLDKVPRYGIGALAAYARGNAAFIYLLAASLQDFPEAVRRWSEQIEYDEENTAHLIEACGKESSSFLTGNGR